MNGEWNYYKSQISWCLRIVRTENKTMKLNIFVVLQFVI